jgi:hypothetical protein
MSDPPELFRIATTHFWLVAILMSFINVAIMWRSSAPHRQSHPSVADGYRSLARGFLFWGNLPWIIMGAGILFGGVPSVFHYFQLKTSNPYILSFAASIVFLWIAGSFWLFARNGAQFLCDHPYFFRTQITNPSLINIFWLVCVAGGALALSSMYFSDFPIPEF